MLHPSGQIHIIVFGRYRRHVCARFGDPEALGQTVEKPGSPVGSGFFPIGFPGVFPDDTGTSGHTGRQKIPCAVDNLFRTYGYRSRRGIQYTGADPAVLDVQGNKAGVIKQCQSAAGICFFHQLLQHRRHGIRLIVQTAHIVRVDAEALQGGFVRIPGTVGGGETVGGGDVFRGFPHKSISTFQQPPGNFCMHSREGYPRFPVVDPAAGRCTARARHLFRPYHRSTALQSTVYGSRSGRPQTQHKNVGMDDFHGVPHLFSTASYRSAMTFSTAVWVDS